MEAAALEAAKIPDPIEVPVAYVPQTSTASSEPIPHPEEIQADLSLSFAPEVVNDVQVPPPIMQTASSYEVSGPLILYSPVPAEMIRREGWIAKKIKTEAYGREPPRLLQSWKMFWAVVCVGHLILFKDSAVGRVSYCLVYINF